MCCESSKSCGMGECARHCRDCDVSAYETGLNAIVELEMHYSESKEAEIEAYIFKTLYSLSNVQSKELRITGLEGNRYDSLDIMKSKVIEKLTQISSASFELYKNADVLYINNDVWE